MLLCEPVYINCSILYHPLGFHHDIPTTRRVAPSSSKVDEARGLNLVIVCLMIVLLIRETYTNPAYLQECYD